MTPIVFPSFDVDIRIKEFKTFYIVCEQATSLMKPLLVISIAMLILCMCFDISSCGLVLMRKSSGCCAWCWQPFYKASVLTTSLILISYLVCFFYKKRLKYSLIFLYGVIISAITAFIVIIISFEMVAFLHIPLDMFSLLFVTWNISVSTSVVILHDQMTWFGFSNFSLLIVVISFGFLLSCLDEVTLWLFVGLVILWDVFAVYHPIGPIHQILRQQREWIYMGDPLALPRGLVYETRRFELGTLDLVMLAVLAGRGAISTGSFCTFLSGVVSVLVGFMTTCLHAIMEKRTVPALPASMTIGIVVYVLCRLLDIQGMMCIIIEKGHYI